VDFVWREQRVIVETDGHETHRTRRAFEEDRLRDQRLIVAGWTVIRITWRQLTQRPSEITDRIARLLSRERAARGL
jgi:very-short-patch-repair endonuclease